MATTTATTAVVQRLTALARTLPRVLSVQSHVVHGYVGNRAATLPLQLLGFDVDPLNTVHFSNHTGLPSFRGTRLTGAEFVDIAAGLEANGFLGDYSHILSGYVGSAATLRAVLDTVDKVRSISVAIGTTSAAPRPVAYVCDPVLGDNGKLYCPEEMVQVYRDEALRRADLITPNYYEASLLSGVPVTDVDSALRACEVLHGYGVPAVVIKCVRVGDERMVLIGSDQRRQERFTIEVGRPLGYISGTGDLMAALLLAHWSQCERLSTAAERATASIQAVLEVTVAAQRTELALVACRELIVSPPDVERFRATLL